MLKTTEVQLHLLIDVDMLLYYGRAVWGGQYDKAHNNYYDDSDEEKQCTYVLFPDVVFFKVEQ